MVILGLALVGVNSLWSRVTDAPAEAPLAQTAKSIPSSLPEQARTLLASAAEIGGIKIMEGTPPAEDCGPGVVTVERVNDLLAMLPAEHSGAISKLLNTTSPVWSAQVYRGEYGTGLCVISENKLVLLPKSLGSGLATVTELLGPLGSAVGDYLPSFK